MMKAIRRHSPLAVGVLLGSPSATVVQQDVEAFAREGGKIAVSKAPHCSLRDVEDALHHATGGQLTFPPAGNLTNDEIAVMDLIAQRKGNRTIARELGLSLYSVKQLVSSILEKTKGDDTLLTGLGDDS